MADKQCKVNQAGNSLEFTDEDGDKLLVNVYSTGETIISIGHFLNDGRQCALSSRAAHELRDFLCRRFPNSTEVQ